MRAIARATCVVIAVCGGVSQAQSASCDEEPTLRSLRGDVKTNINIKNNSGESLLIFWLDYEGKRQQYAILPYGKTYRGSTYATHPWLVARQDGKCVNIYEADLDTTVTIEAASCSGLCQKSFEECKDSGQHKIEDCNAKHETCRGGCTD
jgi:VHL beta domain